MAASAWQHSLLLILLLGLSLCRALETITSSLPLHDGDVLLSDNRKFALGFFSPGKSTKRFIGTWYNQISEQTVFWVANRDNPINDTSGVLSINSDGGLVLYCCSNESLALWFANVSTTVANNATIAQLQDTGNFILLETLKNRVLWQSFDHPTDTKMPSLKIGVDKATGIDRRLTSWKSKDDPASGNFIQRINTAGYPQEILYKNGAPYWREGPWTGQRWSGMPPMIDPFIFNFSYLNNANEITLSFDITNSSILARKVLDPSGVVILTRWEDSSGQWMPFSTDPVEECDFYGHCGPNSNCNPYHSAKFACTCLPGFEPKSQTDWLLRDGSGGCIRSNGTSLCQRGDGFIMVPLVKVPDTRQSRVNMSMSLRECEQDCMSDCSCTAYTAADERNGGSGCLKWYGDLWDTRTFSDIGQYLYVRVDAGTLARLTVSKGSTRKWIVGATASAVVAFVLLLIIIFVNTRRKRGWRSYATPAAAYCRDTEFTDPVHDLDEESRKYDLPFHDLNTIVVATDNFSDVNKLGSGGFGSVYKGILDDGKEIAVKRLSTSSGQGIEEFKNEVALIAKLQHRNLVILLGCCIQGNEKMLIYEYMPNKSLDLFLFDEEHKPLLDWGKRFEIAKGIARGILYLHQDSRLRIIHRDLKTSNVLLDASMNPKISDFGLARICGGDQIEGNTRRVAGTYGYMAPEYAMAGKFSVKSDVYSFGVVLLEIISGKSNSRFSMDLVAHVWKLWKDGSCLDIADPSMHGMYPDGEILRCIQIGLLCVQEFATDRPTMSAVVSMLENNMSLPSPNSPKQPAFPMEGISGGEETSSHERSSANDMSFTAVEGR